MHGDTCATFYCGEVDEAGRLLSERTHEALVRAINAVRPGRQVNIIGRVIESYAKRFGYGVVRDYTGPRGPHRLSLRAGDPALRRARATTP